MLTRTKIALAAALLVGTTTFAAAQGFDPNLANRYPAYADPIGAAPQVTKNRTFQTAPVGLYRGRAAQPEQTLPGRQEEQAFHGLQDNGSFDRAAGGTAF